VTSKAGATRRRNARDKYKPDVIRYLLIAEAPPSEDRFFYFDHVGFADNLFIGTMKVLFPKQFRGYIGQRSAQQKQRLLRSFQKEGFWLLDAVDSPLEHTASAAQLAKISDLESRLTRLRRAGEISHSTPVLFMKANAYRAFRERLEELNFNAINQLVYFPGNGRQNDFAIMFPKALILAGYRKLGNGHA